MELDALEVEFPCCLANDIDEDDRFEFMDKVEVPSRANRINATRVGFKSCAVRPM